MAAETTTTSANDVFFSAWVTDVILEERRPYNVSRPFFRFAPARPSNSYDFPKQDDPGAAGASTEGTGLTNTSLTTAKATATVGTVGQMATVTDELVAVAIVDAMDHFAGVLSRSVAEKYETDFTALYDDFSNVTGTSGTDLDGAMFFRGVSALEIRDVTGAIVSVLHPQQVGDLRADIITDTGAYWGNERMNVNGLDAAALQGYVGTLFGVPIFQTSLVVTANAGADRAGAIFAAGEALGLYEVWGPRVELERDASMPGTEIVTTARYGVVEIDDPRGEAIITDA